MRVAASLLAAGAVIAACVRNPATGKNELMLVRESQEIQMGQRAIVTQRLNVRTTA